MIDWLTKSHIEGGPQYMLPGVYFDTMNEVNSPRFNGDIKAGF